MSDSIIVALIAGGVTLLGSIISMIVSVKNANEHQELMTYRIDQLEQKVMKHNNLIERTYELERRADVTDEKIDVANHRIKNLEVNHHE